MPGPAITAIAARQVWDSRGRPTVEAEITLASGATGRAIAPSGASTGSREALDLRDGGTRLGGFGVEQALAGIRNEIAPALIGQDAADQQQIDKILMALDGTAQKTRLGGNAIVAVSSACAWAASAAAKIPLWAHLRDLAGFPRDVPHIPAPMIQIFGGGRHAGNRIDIQDFLILCVGAQSFAQSCEWTAEVYMAAASAMKKRGKLNGIADEGGVWPDFAANEEGLELLTRAIEAAGFTPGTDIAIALDIAATSFASGGSYTLALDGKTLSTNALIALLNAWCAAYPIISLEDPLGEDDEAGFIAFTAQMGGKIQVIGDDYLTTSAAVIRAAGAKKACNAALLKANQCGTLTELIAASAAARALGWTTIMSGRSGESEDVTLSHLAVGLLADQIKVGSIARAERTAKWNEVIRIAETLGEDAYWRFKLPG